MAAFEKTPEGATQGQEALARHATGQIPFPFSNSHKAAKVPVFAPLAVRT